MCDFFDGFEEVFDNGDSMDDDSFEDSLEGEMDEPFSDDNEPEDKPDETESKDDKFTAKDAFLVGGATGYAYHEGRRKRKRRERKKPCDESN